MAIRIQKEKISNFLKIEKSCDIATLGEDGEPQVATVSFYANEALEIIFGTWSSTRKYDNLQAEQRVGLVFGFDSGVNIQYQGRAAKLSSKDADIEKYLVKKPSAIQKLEDDEWFWFKITPRWVRFTDFTKQPMERFEVNL